MNRRPPIALLLQSPIGRTKVVLSKKSGFPTDTVNPASHLAARVRLEMRCEVRSGQVVSSEADQMKAGEWSNWSAMQVAKCRAMCGPHAIMPAKRVHARA